MSKVVQILYGGSFNPLHVGHLRIAIETLQIFGKHCGRLAFIPSFSPPHKNNSDLLPFDLRSSIIKKAIEPYPNMICQEIEARLPVPSYTMQTLEALRESNPCEEYFFLLGSGDLELLPTWKNGLELLKFTNFIIVQRGKLTRQDFISLCLSYWPQGKIIDEKDFYLYKSVVTSYHVPGAFTVYLASVPYLDISSTRIRQMWLEGANIDFLVTEGTLNILEKNVGLVRGIWQEKKEKC